MLEFISVIVCYAISVLLMNVIEDEQTRLETGLALSGMILFTATTVVTIVLFIF